jgi:hypothetical protein
MGSNQASLRLTGSNSSSCAQVPLNPVAKHRRAYWNALVASLFGLLFLGYVLGAATIFFQLPLAESLTKGFMGARAWSEAQGGSANTSKEQTGLSSADNIDQPVKTFDGYTLYACNPPGADSSWVSLIDMGRREVHHWSIPYSHVIRNNPHPAGSFYNDSNFCIFACHLFENGDLLVVFHSREQLSHGYGLVKVDKNSRLLWSYDANVHHDVVVGEDGVIYLLAEHRLDDWPKGLESVRPPWLVDYLVMLSPEGKELREPISILDALRNSPYSLLLSALETPIKQQKMSSILNDQAVRERLSKQDVLHTNSLSVLTRTAASKFPNFSAGHVLISMRNIDALAVLDPSTASIVWGASGPWRAQHDAQFLESGNLMLFDNLGSPHGSRVLEYDPNKGSFPWYYPGNEDAPFLTKTRGMAQRLPNGNTLIVISESSEGGKIIEVTRDKEVVWSCPVSGFITTARRFSPDQLRFLKPSQRPRS